MAINFRDPKTMAIAGGAVVVLLALRKRGSLGGAPPANVVDPTALMESGLYPMNPLNSPDSAWNQFGGALPIQITNPGDLYRGPINQTVNVGRSPGTRTPAPPPPTHKPPTHHPPVSTEQWVTARPGDSLWSIQQRILGGTPDAQASILEHLNPNVPDHPWAGHPGEYYSDVTVGERIRVR